MTKTPETEVYQGLDKRWRWRVRHPDGTILVDSVDSYASRSDCVAGYQASR